jgi:hypothetical protein
MARAGCATWRRAIDPRLTVIGSFKIWIGTQVRLPYRVIAMTSFFKTQMAGIGPWLASQSIRGWTRPLSFGRGAVGGARTISVG